MNSVIITSNPLRKKGASFERPPFIEEARVHLTVSLLMEVDGLAPSSFSTFTEKTTAALMGMKIAGGDILDFSPIQDHMESASTRNSRLLLVDEDHERDVRRAIRSLMPGYVLVERRQLLKRKQEELNQQDILQVMLDLLALHYEYDDEQDSWHLQPRKEKGWLVPSSRDSKG